MNTFKGRLDVDFVSDGDIDEAIIECRFTGIREMYDLKETIFSKKIRGKIILRQNNFSSR